MAQVTMYRCDVCGKLQEDELKIAVAPIAWEHDGSAKGEFKFSFSAPSAYSRELGVCSADCVGTMFNRWMAARIKEHQIETEISSEDVAAAVVEAHEDRLYHGPIQLADIAEKVV
jgi:hypothetical protein